MKRLLFLITIVGALLGTSGCKRQISNTTVYVEDSIRHYFPIRQGEQLSILYKVENTGEAPLMIQDIHTSCGCVILEQDAKRLVPPEGHTYLHLNYNSQKNVGEVMHSVRIYGNIEPNGIKELSFIVNVVPDPDYTRDYEQLYKEYNLKNGIVDDIVGGKERDKGYYVDSAFQSRRTRDKEKYRLDF